MSKYSEKQLLMLSNFVYLPCSVSDRPISDILNDYRASDGSFTVESVLGAGTGGGLGADDVRTLFTQMDEEISRNVYFGELSAARKLNDGNVRAICYTDKNDDNPVVAFRGTGGSKEAWRDNVEGGYITDTKMQKLASEFIGNECSKYGNLTVTGHSKGGNLSQYVTVACGDRIDRCVSFDGQGFNNDFIESNADKVKAASGKIKSISAYNDYVNILLTPIAGEAVYVDNGNSIKDAHSSLSLLINNEYNDDGNIKSHRTQSVISSQLKNITDRIVGKIDDSSTTDKSMLSFIAGGAVASAFEIKDAHTAGLTATGIMGQLAANLVRKLAEMNMVECDKSNIYYTRTYIDKSGVNNAIRELEDCAEKIKNTRVKLEDIKSGIEMNIASKIYTERKIEKVSENMGKITENINIINNTMLMVVQRYEEKEMNLFD